MEEYNFNNLALSENGFLFDAITGNTFTLNISGKMILQGLIHGSTIESIVTNLLDAFEVTEEVAKNDTDRFIHQMETLGVIPQG